VENFEMARMTRLYNFIDLRADNLPQRSEVVKGEYTWSAHKQRWVTFRSERQCPQKKDDVDPAFFWMTASKDPYHGPGVTSPMFENLGSSLCGAINRAKQMHGSGEYQYIDVSTKGLPLSAHVSKTSTTLSGSHGYAYYHCIVSDR
jgi:hypothetical protein